MGVLRCEIEHPSSVFRGLGHIAPSQGLRATEKGDHARQTAKFLFVHDDHPSRVSRRVQPPFGVPQSGLNGL